MATVETIVNEAGRGFGFEERKPMKKLTAKEIVTAAWWLCSIGAAFIAGIIYTVELGTP